MNDYISDGAVAFIILSRFLFYIFVLAAPIYSIFKLVSSRKKDAKHIVLRSISLLLVVIICISGFISTPSLHTEVKRSNLSEAANLLAKLEPGSYTLDMHYCQGDVFVENYSSSKKARSELEGIAFSRSADIKTYDGVEYVSTPYIYERWQRGRFFRGDFLTGILENCGAEAYVVCGNKLISVNYCYFQGRVGACFRGIFTLDLFMRPKLNLVEVAGHLEKTADSDERNKAHAAA